MLNKVVLVLSLWMKILQMKTNLNKVLSLAQYFPVKLIITLYKVALSVECVDESVSKASSTFMWYCR